MANDKKIIKCLLKQISAMKILFENEIILARMEIRTFSNRHMINHHDGDIVPDSSGYIKRFDRKEEEVWKLREKLNKANKKLLAIIND